MSVYLQGGLVLLNSGNVATNAGCCCGCTTCDGITIPTCTVPALHYLTYTAFFDYSETEGPCHFSANYNQTITVDPVTCVATQVCSGSAGGLTICPNCVSGVGCVALADIPAPDCSGAYQDCTFCGIFTDPCSPDGTSYSSVCDCTSGGLTLHRVDMIELSSPFTPCCPFTSLDAVFTFTYNDGTNSFSGSGSGSASINPSTCCGSVEIEVDVTVHNVSHGDCSPVAPVSCRADACFSGGVWSVDALVHMNDSVTVCGGVSFPSAGITSEVPSGTTGLGSHALVPDTSPNMTGTVTFSAS